MKMRLKKRRGNAGFSLVEVLIALTIVALSFLVTYGTISYTLSQSSRILGETKGTAILQQVVADLGSGISIGATKSTIYQIAYPTTVSGMSLSLPGNNGSGSYSGNYYFFDEDGNYISASSSVPANAVYRVFVSLNKAASSTAPPSPASPNNIYQALIVVYFPAQINPNVGYPNSVSVVTELSN